MSRVFTIDDIQEIKDAAFVTGAETVWCRILFKGCQNFVEFYTYPTSTHAFSRDLYAKFKSGELGALKHGLGDYRTQPKEQHEVEEAATAKRNQLLLESDWSDLPVRQLSMSDEQKAAWATYRQTLRDLTDQESWPWDPVWPTKP
jgi:hypothetical protein